MRLYAANYMIMFVDKFDQTCFLILHTQASKAHLMSEDQQDV